MMESIRAVGYTLEAAVADLVDNCLAVNSNEVRIDFHWAGPESAVVVSDDGSGMDEPTLRDAMRLAGRDPRSERAPKDLGRYALGLKTASFSQGRQLAVESKAARHQPCARYWDLDLLVGQEEWLLRKGVPACAKQYSGQFFEPSHGTIVILNKLDRLLPAGEGYDESVRNRFLEKGVIVKQHLGMVFHRFLEGPDPLVLKVNGIRVPAWDPFLRNHPKTQWLEREARDIFGKKIEVRPFVLPHHSSLTPEEHDRAGGAKGWNAMQGFYVYRGRRLIVAGGYLDLKLLQEPHYSLARIQVDIPNNMDVEWQLDVKKAAAIPPEGLRKSLEKIARITRVRAQEVYRYRGKIVRREHAGLEELVWQIKLRGGKKTFAINRNHPVIRDAIAQNDEAARTLRRVLAVVERSIPLETIAYQIQESPGDFATGAEQADDKEIVTQGMALYRLFRDEGANHAAARSKLLLIEPFGDSAPLIAKIDELDRKAGS